VLAASLVIVYVTHILLPVVRRLLGAIGADKSWPLPGQ